MKRKIKNEFTPINYNLNNITREKDTKLINKSPIKKPYNYDYP